MEGGWKASDFMLTKRIIEDLLSDVAKRDGQLLVVAIPSKVELVAAKGYVPYQEAVQCICAELGIEYLDLAPYFKQSWLRTAFRWGIHWNRNGHAVAAEALYGHLKNRGHI